MTGFWVYMIGILIVVGALGYGAHLLGLPLVWIGIFAAVILGLGIMGAVKKMRVDDAAGN